MSKLFFLLSLVSCGLLIERIDTQLVKNTDKLNQEPKTAGHCGFEKNITFQLAGTNDNSQAVYLEMIRKNKVNLDFLDHFALWNLLQLSIRPDQSSGTSRLQVLLHQEGKSYYFDFFSELSENQYPFLYGIEWVLKKFGKKRTLEQYAELLQGMAPKLKIGKDFENFLIKNMGAIKNNPELAPFYFRGADVLKENESSPLLDYRKILRHYRKVIKDQKIIVSTTLTPFETGRGYTGECNYDFNLYDNSIFLIDKVIPIANLYGFATPKAAFIASSSQKLDQMNSLLGLPLFKGESKIRSSAVCKIENKGNKIWAFSNQSRDPGQHLFHLVRYGLPGSQTTADVDKLIRHSRHLFLSDPVRLIIESARSSDAQIENLLKLNLPIYNADNLGNIWAYTSFKEGHRFIIDDRNPGAFSCQ
jgi:hypothetical protein